MDKQSRRKNEKVAVNAQVNVNVNVNDVDVKRSNLFGGSGGRVIAAAETQ